MSEVRSIPSIRRAEMHDVAALVALMHDFYAEAGFVLDTHWATNSFHDVISNTNFGCIWIALLNDEPVGHVVLTVRYTMEHGAVSGYIDDLYVRPSFRRKDVGSALLRELIQECHARGCKAIYVEVGADNEPARSLYERVGLLAAQDNRVLLSGRINNAST